MQAVRTGSAVHVTYRQGSAVWPRPVHILHAMHAMQAAVVTAVAGGAHVRP